MKRKLIYIPLVAAIVVASTFIAEFSGIFRNNDVITIEVKEGSSISAIGLQLKENGIVTSKNLFVLYSKLTGKTYHMGIHRFSSKNYADIVKELSTPSHAKNVIVTITEGMEQREIANLIEEKGLVTADEFNAAAKIENFDYWFLKDIKKRNMELEGYLFPDTYEFAYDEDAKSIISKMLDNFESKFTDSMKARSKELGFTVDQLITMASIVEREAASKNELALVAGVFYNRLDESRESFGLLQSCATVQYVLEERKLVLSLDDTKIQSDYNTYINKGLPVGPIASPGLNCINAALYPQNTDYLYFVADGNGRHYFAKTYSQHTENMKKAGLI